MKRVLALLASILLVTNTAFADVTSADLTGLGMAPELADKVAQLGLLYAANNDWIVIRNAANSANINVLKVDGSDDTFLNADTGDVINLSIATTPEARISNDLISFIGNTGHIGAPTAVAVSAGAANTPNYTFDNVKLGLPSTGILASSTAIALSAGAANTPNVTFNTSGLRFGATGQGIGYAPYVPTMAATPAAGTNDLKLGVNHVPTAAADTSACLPNSPADGDTVEVFNTMANAVRPKSCSTPGINGGAAGTYFPLAAWSRAVIRYNATLATWLASTEVVPTPAGP